MALVELLHAQLVPDQSNERVGELAPEKYMGKVTQLAESIDAHGLLQNLVATFLKRVDDVDYYQVKAGERRWRAIGMLIADGRWPREKPIPVLVIDGKGWLQQAAENACREDVPIWRQGHKYMAMVESGAVNQSQICAATGKSPAYVSDAMRIARGLAPEIVRALDKLEPGAIPINRLVQIARLVHPMTETPDIDAQRVKLAEAIGRGKRTRRAPAGSDINPRDRVWNRYLKLRAGRMKTITGKTQAVIEAVVDYLEGKTPKLKLPR